MEFLHPSEFIVDIDWSSDTPLLTLDIIDRFWKSSKDGRSDVALGIAVAKTGRAVALGVALAAMDGPLPIMDVAGFAVATALTVRAWSEWIFS
jgi:hypothetical protein